MIIGGRARSAEKFLTFAAGRLFSTVAINKERIVKKERVVRSSRRGKREQGVSDHIPRSERGTDPSSRLSGTRREKKKELQNPFLIAPFVKMWDRKFESSRALRSKENLEHSLKMKEKVPKGSYKKNEELKPWHDKIRQCTHPADILRIISEMKRERFWPDIGTYSIAINIIARKGLWLRFALEILDQLEKDPAGPQPDIVTYTTVLKSCFRAREFKKAFEIWQGMKCEPNLIAYTMMIRACGSDLDQAEKLFDQMEEKNIQPDNFVYSALLSVQARAGAMEKALDTKKIMQDKGLEVHEHCYSSFMMACLMAGHPEKVFQIYIEAEEKGYTNQILMANVMQAHASLKDAKGAELLIADMESRNYDLDASTLSLYLKALAGAGEVEKVERVLRTYKSTVNMINYELVIDIFAEQGRRDIAMRFFRDGLKKGVLKIWSPHSPDTLDLHYLTTATACCATLHALSEYNEEYKQAGALADLEELHVIVGRSLSRSAAGNEEVSKLDSNKEQKFVGEEIRNLFQALKIGFLEIHLGGRLVISKKTLLAWLDRKPRINL